MIVMTSGDEQVEGGERPAAAGTRSRGPRPAWVRLVLLLVLFLLIDAVVGPVAEGLGDVPVAGLPVGLALAALVLLVYRTVVGRLERRDVDELARDGAVAQVRRGTLIGLGLCAVVIGVIAAFGAYAATWGSVGVALTSFGLMCAVAVTEELMFRGVLFRLLEEMAGTWGALVVSALLFGGLHLVNPNATIWGAIAIAIEAGLMLGAAYAATRSLWLPIGIHLGWNFAQSGIFGVTMSGGHAAAGLLKGTLTGSLMLTGGTFGPDGSLVSIVICGIPAIWFLRLAARRGRIHHRRAARR